jgi:hypothetical protein
MVVDIIQQPRNTARHWTQSKNLVGQKSSQDIRDHGFPRFRIIGKLSPIPSVMSERSGQQIGDGPDSKRQRGRVPTHYRPATPLHHFTSEIGA